MIGRTVSHYRIVQKLGAGGMGEVYKAEDTKLRRTVALKFLPPELTRDEAAKRRFLHEAQAASSLDHPNICNIHDIGETDDEQIYLVMACYEGETLLDRICRGPVPWQEAAGIVAQATAGLAHAHAKGIVHRDIKPANLFVTADGTVKILDFGLAKLVGSSLVTKGGTTLGTAAYMSPEQADGQEVDHRTDLWSLGVVLYELLAGRPPFAEEYSQALLYGIIHEAPPSLADTQPEVPVGLQEVVGRCLEKKPADRFASARDLALALQGLVGRMPPEAAGCVEDHCPYPGLAPFTEADAGQFFGREAEITTLWAKIPLHPMMALIGPSGVGKTSFLRAGVVPHAPSGWQCLVSTPGHAPFAGLARSLAPAFAGNPEAVQQLLEFHVPEQALALVARWRERANHALIVVDRFEELFTLRGVETQARFADLLGRMTRLEGVHLLLSVRDDFLFSCHGHPPLAPIFDGIVPLGPLDGEALRRAVVEPASRLGFAFEDEALVEEMLAVVEGERGALPLLAFVLARLWEERNRERRLLTREAYERLGGVAGALARHAEATLEGIGPSGTPIVREIFRNLTTSRQTRCLREMDELLSVFPAEKRDEARRVLDQLVDSRLLTSFEEQGPDGSRRHRVEIVHESLLQRWPRLVRWRTEDMGGALLRDQLRQAAHLWVEKGRPADLLWTGTSYQEYQVWRARHPGGLTEVEEAFGAAMRKLAKRRRRIRGIVYGMVLLATVLVASGLGLLWWRSAEEARQREAAQLLALGRLRLVDHPNAALAYAIASLERSDNGPARRFAVEVLSQGTPALFLQPIPVSLRVPVWSPDGRWLAIGGGGLSVLESGEKETRQFSQTEEKIVGFTSDTRRLVTLDLRDQTVPVCQIWALPAGRLDHSLNLAENSVLTLVNDRLIEFVLNPHQAGAEEAMLVRSLSLEGREQKLLGSWKPQELGDWAIDAGGHGIASNQGERLMWQRFDNRLGLSRLIGTLARGDDVEVWPQRDRIVTGSSSGELRIWDLRSARLERFLKSPADARRIALDPRGRFLACGPYGTMMPRSLNLFDLMAPPTAEPVALCGSEVPHLGHLAFHPDGFWLATSHAGSVILWNLACPRPIVIGRQKPPWVTVAFTRDGHLLSASADGCLKRWPLSPGNGESVRELWNHPGAAIGRTLDLDPGGRFAVVTEYRTGRVTVVPLDGSTAATYELRHPPRTSLIPFRTSLDPTGRYVAISIYAPGRLDVNGIRILDLVTGAERILDTQSVDREHRPGAGTYEEGWAAAAWLPDGRLATDGDRGLRVWNLARGTSHPLWPARETRGGFDLFASPDSSKILRLESGVPIGGTCPLSVFDLTSRSMRNIESHGDRIHDLAIDASGKILVTGGYDGVVRVGPISGEAPHLLFSQGGPIFRVAISPDGRWVAAGCSDGSIRLWPMPDLSKPPLHMLPYGELLAKLRALTNLRAVPSPSTDIGWKIVIGPFPGWAVVPTWEP